MDVNGARLFGRIEARGARAVWLDGILYVAELDGAGEVAISQYPTPEPVHSGSTYWVGEGDERITIQLASCGCQKSQRLGALTIEELQKVNA